MPAEGPTSALTRTPAAASTAITTATPTATTATTAASTPPRGFSQALRLAMPSVVSVYGIGASSPDLEPMFDSPGTRGDERAPWSTAATPASLGSGFFLDARGTIVTAAHVVAQARQVAVKLADQRVLQAERIGLDPDMDVALLRIPQGPGVEPVFGRSVASRPGDWVLAVGEPYGLPRSASAGIVGGLSRHFAEDGESLYIQSDLALNPGNSGGPLLDSSGAIIGMNLRTVVGPYGAGGVSLSIPIEVVRQVADELLDGPRRPPRPRLGASFEDVSALAALDAGRAYASGALLTAISQNGAAARLGLRAGDIVVALNGHPVGDSGDLARLLFTWRSLPGTRVVVWRERRYLELVGV